MRLVHTSTLRLHNFSASQPAYPYAILSHTWSTNDEDEVSFQEMLTPDIHSSPISDKPGFRKIVKTCELARTEYGLEYAWIDTCCIDKSSSAELSESINSMFMWYHRAAVCFAYLEDLSSTAATLRGCKWFQRGWTLQELIAPREVIFLDQTWNLRGNKRDQQLDIADISGIFHSILSGVQPLSDVPVAVRMSWASYRETKRTEDQAYCLLGIFNVNMPMVYGEGERAFVRLQEEIMKESPDMSIFAWKTLPNLDVDYTGILAPSSGVFRTSGKIMRDPDALLNATEFSLTNRGVRFRSPLAFEASTGYFILPVQHFLAEGSHPRVGIYLRQVGPGEFVRALPYSLPETSNAGKDSSIQVAKLLPAYLSAAITNTVVRVSSPGNLYSHKDFRLDEVEPKGSWNPSRQLFYAGHTGVFVGYMEFKPTWANHYDSFVLVIRFDKLISHNPWQFSLVSGDDWKSQKPNFRKEYSFASPMLDRHEATLHHIYDGRNQKTVSLRFSAEGDPGHSQQSLYLDVSHYAI